MCYHSVSLFYIGSNNSDLESATQPGHSQEVEVIRFGDFRMLSLPFADVVLLTLPSHELQLTLEWFVVEREVLGMRNSTSESEREGRGFRLEKDGHSRLERTCCPKF